MRIMDSRKVVLKRILADARMVLKHHNVALARWLLADYRMIYSTAPASTKRRWRSGK